MLREAAHFLASNNIPVISGLAKGVDGYAHTACLKAGGYTLAFLGSWGGCLFVDRAFWLCADPNERCGGEN